ncbi:MAG TPA: L-seryl-tRNA(Sec) selenium transferase [Gallionella sp.]|nr:L-seryl-tRNA(Sec) selenium transferase [Gallionella sp.]
MSHPSPFPSVDRVLNLPAMQPVIGRYGRMRTVEMVRVVLDKAREVWRNGASKTVLSEEEAVTRCTDLLEFGEQPSLRPVFNLTGTVLHTNLGRALFPAEAVQAVMDVLTRPCNLEFDLASGQRGDRDTHVEDLLCQLTGAEAATVVNNNAAAVFLSLNALAARKEVIVSRGELVEIGGAFRVPDIMARAGCRMVEVGTTNRTHLRDFEAAVTAKTALLLKVHASNYVIVGFTAAAAEAELAQLAHSHGLPFMMDLGSGTLVDLTRWGLPAEPTPQQALAAGVDLVTFSGDKLLGGPQAGIIVGRRELIAKIKKNPLKRALRLDKMTIAALEAILRLYRDPDRLAERLPTLRLLTRTADDIKAVAERVLQPLQNKLADHYSVALCNCASQIGSGSLPVERLASHGIAIRPVKKGRGEGTALEKLAAALRALPVPVIARIEEGALVLDLRCLEDEAGFLSQLAELNIAP